MTRDGPPDSRPPLGCRAMFGRAGFVDPNTTNRRGNGDLGHRCRRQEEYRPVANQTLANFSVGEDSDDSADFDDKCSTRGEGAADGLGGRLPAGAFGEHHCERNWIVSRETGRHQWSAAIGSFSWPLLLGAAACSVFYVLIYQGPWNTPFMNRYFTSHPILYFEVGFFWIGAAALLLKVVDLVRQSKSLGQLELPESKRDSISANCERWLKSLSELPRTLQESYVGQRLGNVLTFVERKGGQEGLDEELKYLADQDAALQQESYGLVRIMAWATPMLGFLGTVVGITDALGRFDPKLFSTDINAAMSGLLAGLYVAFDTTALALVLSMTLMLVMFFEDRIETQILGAVDRFVADFAATHFQAVTTADPYVKSVEKMSQAVIKTTETLIRQQTEQWRAAMAETNEQLGRVAEATGQQVRLAIGDSLDQSLANHAERLSRFEADADQRLRERWEQWHQALSENIQVVREQQGEVVKQTELIGQLSQATTEIASLERTLNQNLAALAGSKNFEDTVLSLSAAIQLLSTRLAPVTDRGSHVELRSTAQGKAA